MVVSHTYSCCSWYHRFNVRDYYNLCTMATTEQHLENISHDEKFTRCNESLSTFNDVTTMNHSKYFCIKYDFLN